ncbi:hypothetical protein QJ043_07150 [Olsenella sp. YH-ols2217]|uniref:Zinc ribbon domain-containing protein n=1 Tax=Kribbibacterium absianum TaxID=3044210 RepID=A0ABT6ZMI7_9ACTN|nr:MULTISPECIES: hypothetical protein [unclassified Olsenella]MDJ1121843.1 hypothetical protein [Olsenella sp. YH-ols2216]MDJ1129851.1 hypothetical protein [Olsenella sp. YH-ols2217]
MTPEYEEQLSQAKEFRPMECPLCHEPVNIEDEFCHKCGTSLYGPSAKAIKRRQRSRDLRIIVAAAGCALAVDLGLGIGSGLSMSKSASAEEPAAVVETTADVTPDQQFASEVTEALPVAEAAPVTSEEAVVTAAEPAVLTFPGCLVGSSYTATYAADAYYYDGAVLALDLTFTEAELGGNVSADYRFRFNPVDSSHKAIDWTGTLTGIMAQGSEGAVCALSDEDGTLHVQLSCGVGADGTLETMVSNLDTGISPFGYSATGRPAISWEGVEHVLKA